MALPAIIAGAIGATTATLKFADNKLVAYLLVILFLIGDGGLSAVLGWQGVAGFLFGYVINFLIAPLSITVYSWQVLIIVGILPLIIYAIHGSLNS